MEILSDRALHIPIFICTSRLRRSASVPHKTTLLKTCQYTCTSDISTRVKKVSEQNCLARVGGVSFDHSILHSFSPLLLFANPLQCTVSSWTTSFLLLLEQASAPHPEFTILRTMEYCSHGIPLMSVYVIAGHLSGTSYRNIIVWLLTNNVMLFWKMSLCIFSVVVCSMKHIIVLKWDGLKGSWSHILCRKYVLYPKWRTEGLYTGSNRGRHRYHPCTASKKKETKRWSIVYVLTQFSES